MNRRFPFSLGFDTKTDILFLSLENSNVASFLNPILLKIKKYLLKLSNCIILHPLKQVFL